MLFEFIEKASRSGVEIRIIPGTLKDTFKVRYSYQSGGRTPICLVKIYDYCQLNEAIITHSMERALDKDLNYFINYVVLKELESIKEGFTDVNGQKIFEGDIIERAYSVNRPKLRMYVVNHKGSWRLWSHEDDEDFLTNWCRPHSLNGRDIGGCIVVGNIHDDPELVTGGTLASSNSDGVF